MTVLLILGSGLALATLAGLAPLLCYSLSLAALGMPHVLAELRYVDARFGARLDRRLVSTLALLLGILVLLRFARLEGSLDSTSLTFFELGLLILLVLATVPWLARSSASGLVTGMFVLVLVACGILWNPAATLVILALLHNLTPLGFLLERLQREHWPQLGVLAFLLLVALPALFITGTIESLFAASGIDLREASLLATGPLRAQLGAFVPGPLEEHRVAARLFAAAVYLQLLHYAAVLHVLPRLVRDEDASKAVLSWPGRRAFSRFLVFVGTLSFLGFLISFSGARLVYAVFAAVHAFLEIPILLLALSGLRSAALARPELRES